MKWRVRTWPRDTAPEGWRDVGEPVEAPTWEAAVEEAGLTEPGRYLIENAESDGPGQYFRRDSDGTIVPVDGF